ncbi:ribosomal RNA small subunit methyltransferase, mitochondrial [Pistacia vera]|uniref:ribosomal RNA small subunit methyltransferase, mitochondrial n=1 Tax=Pistacia vera TaxID=55513 RepID=UPI001262F931|nr:ribosomal RNA small subunit methyltransferase, mitochondrial [Pistacia vera]
MLHKPIPFRLYLTRFNYQQLILRELRTKSSNRYTQRNGEDDELKIRNPIENQEDRLYFHKSKGQHILTNQRILDSIVRKSNINPNDTVLEIGPGTGNLTLKLLEVSKKVFAIELDKRMEDILNKRVAERGFKDKLTVIWKDALKAEFTQFDLVVANIPYGISSPLVAKLVYGTNHFRSATLLLQKEFAKRLLANPGDSEFNRLAVNVKLVADVEFVMDVSRRDFVPCPKVDSSVVIIRPKADIPKVNLDEWLAFTRTCFGKKNKTLGAIFKQKKKVIELLRLSKKMGPINENVEMGDCCGCSEEDDDERESEGEDFYSSSCSELEASSFKEKIIEVLKSGGFEDKRPSKLSHELLLHLLSSFNQAGIIFHDQTEQKNAGNTAFAASYNS